MGHEFSGVIEEVLESATNSINGDCLVINSLFTQGNKDASLYINGGFNFVVVGQDDGFADFFPLGEKHPYNIPVHAILEDGAFIEPSAVVHQALKTLKEIKY